MATFRVNDYIHLGTPGYHNASSWEVSLDSEFTQIIDATYKDKINVKSWSSMLPKINGNGYYADLDELHARVKVWIDDNESDWFIVPIKNQNNQQIIITEENKEPIITNSLVIGLN